MHGGVKLGGRCEGLCNALCMLRALATGVFWCYGGGRSMCNKGGGPGPFLALGKGGCGQTGLGLTLLRLSPARAEALGWAELGWADL